MWGRNRPSMLRLADRLGRGRTGRRLFDRMRPAEPAPSRPDFSNWQNSTLAAAWIGHATLVLRIGNTTILTDPVFSPRVGLDLGLLTGGPARLVAPAIEPEHLPPIDLLLISHAHFDHLDRPSLARFAKSIPVVTAHNTRDLIADLGFASVQELNWEQSLDVAGVSIKAHKVNHWGARTLYDNYRGFNAYELESQGRRILYGGDTAYHDGFKSIAPVDLAVIGIGAYDPWIQSHASPEQAWEMASHVKADYIAPMHHSTFSLSREPVSEPLERLLAAAKRCADRVVIRGIGTQWALT